MPPRRKHVPPGAHESIAHLTPTQRKALTSGGQQPGRAPIGYPDDQAPSFTASIAEGLRDLGLARLLNGDEAGAQRLLYGAETLCQESEREGSAGDDRLDELRQFARMFSEELTGANDDAEEVDHTHVPDDVSDLDEADMRGTIGDLLAEIRDLRKVESAYIEFRRTLGVLSDKYRIEDEL